MSKSNKGRIGGDVLADIKKWTKDKPKLKEAIKKHQEKHYAKINKKAQKYADKLAEEKRNTKESQAAIGINSLPNSVYTVKVKGAKPKSIKLALKTPLTGKAIYEEPAKIMTVYYNEIKKPVKVIKKDYKFIKGFLKPAEPKKIILKCQNKRCINHNPIAENGCAHYNDTGNCTGLKEKKLNVQPGWNNPQPKKKRKIKRKKNKVFDCEFILGKNALVDWTKKPAKKKNYNDRKLKAKHKDLWLAIGKAVALDITDQQGIINSDTSSKSFPYAINIPMRFIENVSENAAFTAIVEMIKRGLL